MVLTLTSIFERLKVCRLFLDAGASSMKDIQIYVIPICQYKLLG